jgi:hypothetical protein
MNWLNQNRTYAYLGKPANPSATLVAGDGIVISFTDHAVHEEGFKVEHHSCSTGHVVSGSGR